MNVFDHLSTSSDECHFGGKATSWRRVTHADKDTQLSKHLGGGRLAKPVRQIIRMLVPTAVRATG